MCYFFFTREESFVNVSLKKRKAFKIFSLEISTSEKKTKFFAQDSRNVKKKRSTLSNMDKIISR